MELNEDAKKILESGGYAKKQIFSDSSILRWSHQQRFKKGLQLIRQKRPETVLDYGCGDGTFLLLAKDLAANKIGLEIDINQLEKLKERFQGENDFSFQGIQEAPSKVSDFVTCFEVLEHCTEEVIEENLIKLKNFCKVGGTVVISVPKETGPSLLIKQVVRRLLALRNYGSYEHTEYYNISNFFKMFFATENTQIERNYYEIMFGDQKYTSCGHYGFNWKKLKLQINNHFEITSIEFTPNLLPFGLVSSQVWFVCRLR